MGKQRSERRKKRRFSGNQFSKPKKTATEVNVGDLPCSTSQQTSVDSQACSASRRKLSSVPVMEETPAEPEHTCNGYVTGFRFIDLQILASILMLLPCPECYQLTIALMENNQKRQGCASQLKVICQNCGWKEDFFTSPKGEKAYDVNRRFVYAMRSLGKGHSGAKKFCGLMNMPEPLAQSAYWSTSKIIGQHVKTIAKESMSAAASELKQTRQADDNGIVDCAVSCDGTWQRRGFSSLNGCVTVISMDSGKILDAEAMSRSCKQCQLHSHLDQKSEEYLRWKADHTCKIDFKGSAPAMEPQGAELMFNRSKEIHKLRYSELYGDGDSKTHQQVKDIYVDDGIEVTKQECIGHVQKRAGTGLRKAKKDNPGLGGKGKLTDSIIDKMQNYFGIAIRANIGNLEAMKKAVLASFFHCASSAARPLHTYCPVGPDSWCGYQRDKATYKHGAGLPLGIIAKVKPIYQRLTEDGLLQKCLHGKTQNQNESFNGMIWQRIPKAVYVGKDLLELGLFDAVAHFNMGSQTILQLFKALGITPGAYTAKFCSVLDKDRLNVADRQAKEKTKKRRKVLRGNKKKKMTKTRLQKVLLMGLDNFDNLYGILPCLFGHERHS